MHIAKKSLENKENAKKLYMSRNKVVKKANWKEDVCSNGKMRPYYNWIYHSFVVKKWTLDPVTTTQEEEGYFRHTGSWIPVQSFTNLYVRSMINYWYASQDGAKFQLSVLYTSYNCNSFVMYHSHVQYGVITY